MKRETKAGLGGFLTAFFTTLLLMGAAFCVLYLVLEYRAQVKGNQQPGGPSTYLPEAQDRLTLLLAGRESDAVPPDLFLLVGFLPDRGKVTVCLLPPSTYVPDQGLHTTLAQLYDRGGVRYAQKVLAQYLDIPIQRYAQGDLKSLDKLMMSQGLMDYHLPVDIRYSLRGREVVMPRGDYQLDGRKAADILLCTAYQGGELERSDRGAMLLSQLIQELLPAFLTDRGDQLAGSVLSWLETDTSYADYEERRGALGFLAALELPATTTLFLEGEVVGAARDGTGGVLRLSPSCLDRIRETYGDPEGQQGQPPQSAAETPQRVQRPPASFQKEFY